jgi:hypothetical protein
MTTSLKFSLIAFFLSVIFLLITVSIGSSATSMDLKVCHHCGSASACEDGGQAYGWTQCEYNPNLNPPDNCQVYGSPHCC